jgi:hypothetical protein
VKVLDNNAKRSPEKHGSLTSENSGSSSSSSSNSLF